MYTLLIAEDERDLREAILRSVDWKSAGFEVVGAAENGAEALEMVEQFEPDLVMTDIKMPILSGLELASRIREIRPATQIVILSGYDSFTYAQTAIKYNVISYILKPVSSSELTQELIRIHGIMDSRISEMKGETQSEAQLQLRLEKTELLLPLLLGDKGQYRDEVLLPKARELGIIKDESPVGFGVAVSKFAKPHGEAQTDRSHIPFVDTIFRKYASSESFFVGGRIISLITVPKGTLSEVMDLPSRELVQSAKRLLGLKCTVGISRETDSLAACGTACFEALTARRYTSDGAGEIRFIDDQEHGTDSEYEDIEKSVFKLEQILKTGTDEKITEFLDRLYSQKKDRNDDYLMMQILATVHRTVSAVADREALSELVRKSPVYAKTLFYETDDTMQHDLTELCLGARRIIAGKRKRETEVICDRVVEIIEREYSDEQLSLAGVSARLGISPNYLSTLIKKTKKDNFISLLTERRMKAAYDMLVMTSLRILEIAEKCGYSDQHYFSYCFKKYYGMSPNKLRENHR